MTNNVVVYILMHVSRYTCTHISVGYWLLWVEYDPQENMSKANPWYLSMWPYLDKRSLQIQFCSEVLLLKVKQCLGLPDPGKDKEGSSPRDFRESMTLPRPSFLTSSLQKYERIHFHCFKSPCFCNSIMAELRNEYKWNY